MAWAAAPTGGPNVVSSAPVYLRTGEKVTVMVMGERTAVVRTADRQKVRVPRGFLKGVE